jgi:hypothetical protein
MVANHVAVPPTPYYYGLRAEWFRKEMQRAFDRGEKGYAERMLQRYLHFEQLSNQIPLGILTEESNEARG